MKENNIVNIELNIFERDGNVYHRSSERFKERAYEIGELKEMLSDSGFEVVAVYNDMTTEELSDTADRAVFVARMNTAINRE